MSPCKVISQGNSIEACIQDEDTLLVMAFWGLRMSSDRDRISNGHRNGPFS